jgi:hypothetical protein
MKAAVKDESEVTLAFDMQRCLPTPMLKMSVVFYKQVL